jgi:hypothetical protein
MDDEIIVLFEDDETILAEMAEQGPKGGTGDTGAGVPAGGATGQVLKKKSATDYDTEWGDAATGSGASVPDFMLQSMGVI